MGLRYIILPNCVLLVLFFKLYMDTVGSVGVPGYYAVSPCMVKMSLLPRKVIVHGKDWLAHVTIWLHKPEATPKSMAILKKRDI